MNYRVSVADGTLINSFGDILKSQYVHYYTCNGRFVAHTIVQWILAFTSKYVFAFINATVYLAFVTIILRLCNIPVVSWRKLLLTTCLIIIGFQTKFVPTCQIGYVWMFTLSLSSLYFFKNPQLIRNNRTAAFVILLSLAAGNGQEALSIGMGGGNISVFY